MQTKENPKPVEERSKLFQLLFPVHYPSLFIVHGIYSVIITTLFCLLLYYVFGLEFEYTAMWIGVSSFAVGVLFSVLTWPFIKNR